MKRFTLLAVGLAIVALTGAPSRGQEFLGKGVGHWEGQLASKDAAERRSAAFALGKIGPLASGASDKLLACLTGDANKDVRETAAYSLGQLYKRGLAPANVIDALCNRLGNAAEDALVRRSCAVALGSCGSDTPQVRAALEKAVGDANPGVRQNAAWALGEVCQLSAEVPVGALRKALADGDKLVQRDAALALGQIVSHQPTHDQDSERREQDRLEKVRGQARAALPELVSGAKHSYLEMRKASCGTLVSLVKDGDDEAAKVLAERCKDEDIEVRRNAALALAAIGGKWAAVAVPELGKALKEGDTEMKRLAALAFLRLGEAGAAALPDLCQAAKSKDHELRYNAVTGLGGLKAKGHAAVPVLTDILADTREDNDVRVAAARSLQSIGACKEANDVVPKLLQVLNNRAEPKRVRERVLWALRVHNTDKMAQMPEVLEALTKLLSEPGLGDPNAPIGESGKMLRYDAAYLLCRVKRTDAPDDVLKVLLDFLHDSSIRIYGGLKSSGDGVKEKGSGKGTTTENLTQDGRLMAVQALSLLSPDRVVAQPKIISQLRAIRDGAMYEEPLREAAGKLLQVLNQ
jgi:HEAT repeat protein